MHTNFGKPVTEERLEQARRELHEMMPSVSYFLQEVILDAVRKALEKDTVVNVIEKAKWPVNKLDVTGRYRLLAAMCVEPKQPPK